MHTHSSCYSCQILIKLELSTQMFEKYSNMELHENPSSGNRAVPRAQTDRQTGMTKLTVAFRSYAKWPEHVNLSLFTLRRHLGGSRGISPVILNHDTRWRCVVPSRTGRFTPGK